MRIDPAPRPPAAWLPDRLALAWARLAAFGPRVRLGLAVAALAVLAATAYYLIAPEATSYNSRLNGGRPFANDELARVVSALDGAKISFVESGGRLAVPADRLAEAVKALAEAGVGPRTPEELRVQDLEGYSIFDSPEQRAKKELVAKERGLEAQIAKLAGVATAQVTLNAEEHRQGFNRLRRLAAFVDVRPEGEGGLAQADLDAILAILGAVDIDPDRAKVYDLKASRPYWNPGDPAAAGRSTSEARAEELRKQMLDAMAIPGAKVLVSIDPPAPSPTATGGSLAINVPLSEANATKSAGSEQAETGRVLFLIRVPRSYYFELYHSNNGDKAFRPEDLKPYVDRVDETIRRDVEMLLRPDERQGCSIKVERYDDLAESRPVVHQAEADPLRSPAAWLAAGAGAGALAVGVLGIALMAARRPSTRPDGASRRPTIANDPGGSDALAPRVRDLVRRDPAAAAGILHRWIAQGGTPR